MFPLPIAETAMATGWIGIISMVEDGVNYLKSMGWSYGYATADVILKANIAHIKTLK